DARADDKPLGAPRATRRQCRRRECRRRRRPVAMAIAVAVTRADFYREDRHVARASVAQQLADAFEQIRVHPVDDETIRREELDDARALLHLQRTHPRVELLLRKLRFKRANTMNPERAFHERGSPARS